MKCYYSFDDTHFGVTNDGTKIDIKVARRPPGLTNEAWYTFAGELVTHFSHYDCMVAVKGARCG